MPFLENVLRGRNVPRERMLAVAEHYHHFDGKSPINDHNRALIAALERELASHGLRLPIYWGNRNWHPLLADTLRQMQADGVRKALAFVTSIFSSYSGCRQYLEDIERARAEVDGAPEIHKLRKFYNHPLFIEAQADEVRDALGGRLSADHFHRAQHSADDGRDQRLSKAASGSMPAGCRERGYQRLAAGLPEPQRTRPASRGWNPISAMCCARWSQAPRWRWCRSGLCPITSK